MAEVEDDWQAGIDEALAGLDDMLQDELDSEVEVEEAVEPTSLLPPVQVLQPEASTSKLAMPAVDTDITPLSKLDDPAIEGERPTYNWWTLIRAAILESPNQRMTLNDIYDAVSAKYSFFQSDGDTWRVGTRSFVYVSNLTHPA
jgi:hypothetical protein